ETLPLPRPLQRFGSAFPKALAATFATAYAPERGLVLDPLAFPWSAADAAEHVGRRGIARSREPLGAWARDVVRMAPAADELLIALERVADSALIGPPHRGRARRVRRDALHAAECHRTHGDPARDRDRRRRHARGASGAEAVPARVHRERQPPQRGRRARHAAAHRERSRATRPRRADA